VTINTKKFAVVQARIITNLSLIGKTFVLVFCQALRYTISKYSAQHGHNYMKVSTKGRYGLRAMLELSLRDAAEPTMVRDIAAAQEISEDYLELVLISLRKAGMVRSVRGASGGYFLARPPEKITALEIIEAVEGPLQLLECLQDEERCNRTQSCAARDLWCEASTAMRAVFVNTTLANLRDRQRGKTTTAVFHI
jgi:Rrf2 family transcriptional regulator, cysteine metabolism repressor